MRDFLTFLCVEHIATLLYRNLLSFFLLKLLAKSDRCHNMSHLTKLIFRLHPAIFGVFNIFINQLRFTSHMVQTIINHVNECDTMFRFIQMFTLKLSCEDSMIYMSLIRNHINNSYLPGWEVNRDH